MKSPADMRVIQIEVTNAWAHSCSNCTRFCGQHAKPFGRVLALPETTMLYRCHEVDATADPYSSTLAGAVRRTMHAPGAPRRCLAKWVLQSAQQARSLVTRYLGPLEGRDLAALEAAGELPSLGFAQRRLAIVRHGLWFASPLRNAGLWAFL